MCNDSAPAREDFEPVLSEEIEHILCRWKSDPVAVFLVVKTNEIHFCFAPRAWGLSQAIAESFMSWLWENTTQDRFTGPVPSYNRLALRLAKVVGFSQYDISKNAVQRRGVLYDLLHLEIARP